MANSTSPHVILSSDPAYAQLLQLAGPALGGVLSVNDTRSLDLAATAGVQLRILRDSASDGLDPSDAASHLLDRDWTNIVALQLACESGASDSADWQLETIRALRGRGWTRGIVGGAWATGNPAAFDRTTHADGSPHFPALLPFAPVFAATDYFALHGYVGCLPGDAAWPDAITWYACRHRLYDHCLQQHGIPVPRWLYTESGLDRVQGRTAAGRDGVTAQQYAALVAALAAEDAKDGIPMRAYFTLGPTPDWAAFAWADAVPAIAAEIVIQAKTTPQSPAIAPVAPAILKEAPMTGYGKATWVPSPNFWRGRNGMAVTTVVLHGTAGPSAAQWFQNPASQVSAHYVVSEDASIAQCVDETNSAWHAGIATPNSAYYGGPNPNYFSIGIEHERNVANNNPMPEAQIIASLALVADILRRYGPLKIITHDQIDVGRVCPGPGFPLDRFLALLQSWPQPELQLTPTPIAQEVEAVITITPAIQAAAVERYAALGIKPLQQGAIFAEFLARYAVGQANPTHNAILPTPALTPEVTPDASGDAYVLFDDGSIWVWRKAKGAVYLLEEKDRAATMKLCGWGSRFA